MTDITTFRTSDTSPNAHALDGLHGIVGIPCAESSRHSMFWSDVFALHLPPHTAVQIACGSSPAQNRNTIIETALASPTVEWVMFLDDDHVIPPDALTRLLAHDVDVVSALYVHRSPPFRPLVFDSFDPAGSGGVTWRTLTNADHGLIECAAVPAGGLLVKRKVFEWMRSVTLPIARMTRKSPPPPKGHAWFRLGHIKADEWGDDIDFCRTVGSLGFKIWCDLDLVFGHLATMELRPVRTDDGWMTMAIRGENALMGRTWT